ncbi:MAG: amino acid ABC transporter substrate-binding protein [Simkaniaceae bacterium]|nr:amino acid ABC transporter substrate-binding protein [Simkaniaceae bacterium]
MKRIAALCILFLLVACSKKSEDVTIGVDPSFFPLEIQGREANLFAFSTEVLQEIGEAENISFERVTTSWDNLLWGLREHQYSVALSSLDMYVFNTAKYSFSNPYLLTGPVLIVPVDSAVNSFVDLAGSTIAVEGEESAKYVLSQDSSILVQVYATFGQALDEVNNGVVAAALVPYIPALSYVNNVYQGQLKIITAPAMNQGIRLITNKDAHPKLIKQFNEGLERLQKSGRLEELKKKWSLAA